LVKVLESGSSKPDKKKNMIYLDTHVLVWLHAKRVSVFPKKVKQLLNTSSLFISPAVYLELQCLFEIGKLKFQASEIYSYLEHITALSFSVISFEAVAKKASGLSWTRDPFDRLIVADALAADSSTLITRDGDILDNYSEALWE
jgi:PIN domain nuclease of toxin-antitoxin system